jgi:hypothetical protein
MPNHLFTVILLLYLCAIAAGQEWQDYAQDWLNGDYYGSPYYIDGNTYYSYTPIRFTDPVFSPYGYVNYTYPYFSDDIFTYGLSPYSGYSSPRYRSDLWWQTQNPQTAAQNQPNWTQTINIARSQSSSLRVYRNGQWVAP